MPIPTFLDAENIRDFVSYDWKFMKWKFSLWANLELKFFRKLLLKNWKCHLWSFSWWFFVENHYNLVQGHKKKHPLIKICGPAPSHSHNSVYNGIMEYMRFYENTWLDFRNYSFLHMFCIRLHTNLHWNRQNCPIFTI